MLKGNVLISRVHVHVQWMYIVYLKIVHYRDVFNFIHRFCSPSVTYMHMYMYTCVCMHVHVHVCGEQFIQSLHV